MVSALDSGLNSPGLSLCDCITESLCSVLGEDDLYCTLIGPPCLGVTVEWISIPYIHLLLLPKRAFQHQCYKLLQRGPGKGRGS